MPGRDPSAVTPFIAVACLALVGCNRPNWTTPDAAYTSFARAVKKGEYNVAWDALSEASRAALEKRSRELSAASGGALEDDPQAFFFGSTDQPEPVRNIEVLREEGTVAQLSVTPEAGAPREVRMVKESGGWKLDVSDALKD